MGNISAFVLAIGAVLIGLGLLLGWMNYKIDKLKEEDKLNIETIGSIIVLEKAVKKLNEALKTHEQRLDILEGGHQDTDIDYGEVDDDANVIAVWFNGKKYVPEDKKDEDTFTFYANGKVAAVETTRPEEKRCCAIRKHYQPGVEHTCNLRSSACNNYEKVVLYKRYKGMVGNGEIEKLTKRIEKLNYIYNTGLISMVNYRRRLEELMLDDS